LHVAPALPATMPQLPYANTSGRASAFFRTITHRAFSPSLDITDPVIRQPELANLRQPPCRACFFSRTAVSYKTLVTRT
jgi:hypothetical protein